jgi:hypothetical protein
MRTVKVSEMERGLAKSGWRQVVVYRELASLLNCTIFGACRC